MFGLGKKQDTTKLDAPSFKDLAGVILSQKAFIKILQPKFDKKIIYLSKDGTNFTLHFDTSESVNAYILGHEDLVKLFMDYYGRNVIDVTTFEDGHQQYLIRFEE